MQKVLAAIFDLSFRKFVTPQLASLIYVISIVWVGVSSIFLLRIPLGFILAPIFFVASVFMVRAGIELVLAVFQIARYSAEIARRGRPEGSNEEGQDDSI